MKQMDVIVGIIYILIDIFNLVEQFAIFFIARSSALDESTERRFFFILFGIGATGVFRPCIVWSKPNILIGLLIEVGEFLCYMLLLQPFTNLIIVATVFLVLEGIFHVVIFLAASSDWQEHNEKGADRLRIEISCSLV